MIFVLTAAKAQDFRALNPSINSHGQFTVMYPSVSNAYYLLYRSERLSDSNHVVALKLGEEGTSRLTDASRSDSAAQAYYWLRRVALSESLDSDGDGLPDVYELQRPDFLNALSPADASLDYDGDGQSNLQEFVSGSNPADLPPDPAAVVSAVSRTGVTSVANATEFLYTGPNAIQTGVANGAFDGRRVCVLRGKVIQRNGAVLPGVTINVLGHPEFGQTKTRSDGMFDLAVNGGGRLTVNFERPGYCPAQRPVATPWADYLCLPDVVMITMDAAVTAVSFGTNAPSQVARGTTQGDEDGSRRATLIVQPGTCANLVMGGSTQSCSSLNLRATEFTVGGNGPTTMPGQLPANSAYTYCVELSADEAGPAGSVEFTQPLCFYVENFLNFPVGQSVPSGFYDRQKGAWVGSQNGRVIKVLNVTNGVAVIDANGDGLADSAAQLSALGFTDAELRHVGGLYAPAQTLWRTCIAHFSPWDCNWPYGPPPDAKKPPAPPAQKPPDNPCKVEGSLIEVERQTLGEMIGIVGTPYSLHYNSHRVRGYLPPYRLEIPLSEDSLPASLRRIELRTEVVGRLFNEEFPPAPNQQRIFTWDGLDAYGRSLPGTHPVHVRVGYVYEAAYLTPSQFEQAFAAFSDTVVAGNSSRQEITLWKEWKAFAGNLLSDTAGLGSWTIDIHHAYDPRSRTLHYGDGRRRSAVGLQYTVITTFAGGANTSAIGDGGPATSGRLHAPSGIAVAPDGTVFIAESVGNRVRKVTPNGIISTIAGSTAGQACHPATNACGDGGPATLALLNNPQGLAVAPDGTLYIADRNTYRVRKVDTNGIISTVAGTGVFGFSGDGGPATQAQLYEPYGVTVAPDQSIYVADMNNGRIRRIGLDGIINTVVGTNIRGFNGDGRPALQTQLNRPYRVFFGPDENLYIVDRGQNRIRKVGIDGIVSTVAGAGGASEFAGDGGDATLAKFSLPEDLAFGADGSFYIADTRNFRVRFVGPEGIMTTVAGNGIGRYSGDGGPATQAGFSEPTGVAVGPDGALYLSDWFYGRVRKVTSALPGFSATDSLIASEDGRELFVFDNAGRHLRTIDAFTKAVRFSFAYDSEGRLSTITDGDNNVTTIERDTTGSPMAILSPYGQRTTLSTHPNGYIASISNPADETFSFNYSNDGLLLSMTNPRSNSWTFRYDAMGRLTNDLDPVGGFKALSRSESATGSSIEVRTALARTNRYETINLSTGDRRRIYTFPTGLQTERWERTDGATTNRFSDGTIETLVEGPDPRWGMLAPLVQSATTQIPGGPTYSNSVERGIVLTNSADPFSFRSWSETNRINGRGYTNIFTAATRVMTNFMPTGRRLVTTYDSLMRPLREEVPGLAPVQYTYDGRGRLATLVFGTGAEARTNRYFYGPHGYLTNTIDSLGRSKMFEHDLAGRLTREILADGRVIQQHFDRNGNRIGLTPPGRPGHEFAFSPVDLVARYSPPAILPGTNYTDFGFNLDRDLTLIRRPDGLATHFDYAHGDCTCDRLNSILQPRGTNAFTYHPLTGKPAAIMTADGVNLLFAYAGTLLTTQTWAGAVNGSVSYTYDNDHDIASRRIVGGSNVVFQYDLDKLLARAGDLSITRSAQNGLISNTVLGSITNSWSYNQFGEATNHRAMFGSTVQYSEQFARDAGGRIINRIESVGAVTNQFGYSYDLSGRLVVVMLNGTTNTTYTYDTNDNRLTATTAIQSSTATYDQQDRLLSYGAATYGYTANGELASRTIGSQTTTYQYDVLGNLIRVVLPNAVIIDYLVDGLNRRVGKRVNGVLTQGFLYDSDSRLVAELDGAGNVLNEFIYGTMGDAPDYLVRGGQIYRIITDHLGSPRLVVDATSGQIAQRIDYDAFGRVLADTAPGFQPIGFAGGLYDPDTGLIRFGARDYDAQIGRWTAKDPILFEGGQANLYAYVDNDPVNRTDPLGLGEKKPFDLKEFNKKNCKDLANDYCRSAKDSSKKPLKEYTDTTEKVEQAAKEGGQQMNKDQQNIWEGIQEALKGFGK